MMNHEEVYLRVVVDHISDVPLRQLLILMGRGLEVLFLLAS